MKQKHVVIITGPGFEDAEVLYPYYRLKEEGFLVDVATSTDAVVTGKYGVPMANTIRLEDLKTHVFDAVIIPGGHEAPDRVRQKKEVLTFVKGMYEQHKVISSTCHGIWVLISSGIMKGKKATCYIGMKDDLINAGALYSAKPVVEDHTIVTSDHPRNLGAWMKKTISLL